MNITELEFIVLKQIITSDFTALNGSEPNAETPVSDLCTWVDCIEDNGNVRGKQLSGIMSSLKQKGLIWTDGETCNPTKDGLKIYISKRK